MMDQRKMLGFAASATLGLALLPANTIAQQKSLKEQLIGTWALVLCESVAPDGTKTPLVVGSNPAGQYIFTPDSHFSLSSCSGASRVRVWRQPENNARGKQSRCRGINRLLWHLHHQ
jgi:hypothetical protein